MIRPLRVRYTGMDAITLQLVSMHAHAMSISLFNPTWVLNWSTSRKATRRAVTAPNGNALVSSGSSKPCSSSPLGSPGLTADGGFVFEVMPSTPKTRVQNDIRRYLPSSQDKP